MTKAAVTQRILSIGEVSRRSGLPASTLHFYESIGLITSTRSAGNQRRYSSRVLRYLAILKVAQRVGVPLEDVRATLGPFDPTVKPSSRQWKEAGQRWRAHLDERISQLQRLRDELSGCIGCGCLSLEDCPLRNPNDVMGEKGPGAHILERP
ncbi:MerR family transcriptional regulator [Halopseudomonas oceani]|uniref:Redox-sensitive transcriptional activator SoxR n=1 Tax=Halopseudomonas oceani TaxID=1708783 RepID=A0A2P4F0M1_9GAMM|nr:redox-sensitive transcriptional activator SoxR [Halopseudomonas oceani]POB06555.1 redox-sensitive transcriptional activator SoxR [Halopseudomonas oceani]GGE34353.1 MerR family transcriptional regulator [Halopseudomonas oceani]